MLPLTAVCTSASAELLKHNITKQTQMQAFFILFFFSGGNRLYNGIIIVLIQHIFAEFRYSPLFTDFPKNKKRVFDNRENEPVKNQ